MSLSVASNATILAARHAYAKPSRAAAPPQSAVPANLSSAVPSATAASPTAAVKPATPVAGFNPSALVAAAGDASGLTTSRADGDPSAFSPSDYAKAIAAYTGQSVTTVAGSPAVNVTPVDGAKDVAGTPVAPAPEVGQASVDPRAAGAFHAGSHPDVTQPNAPGAVASTENSNLAAQAAIASPPSVPPQAGGQPHPIAAPTQHAVMSLLKVL